eukprot:TRINITY_DN9488_c0_g1_i1.p1 TRINITY_DN9488_c0_g1~~TRINITY_DN9488_c0_g1_i1.p1  ORF type:complete len:2039 (+),score=443.47 TRINITY_DN9488_c0_g1_i1:542-6118(+)
MALDEPYVEAYGGEDVRELQSLEGATRVIYLNISALVTEADGNYTVNHGSSKADLFRMWQVVAAGLSAFDVNVVTDKQVYEGVDIQHRGCATVFGTEGASSSPVDVFGTSQCAEIFLFLTNTATPRDGDELGIVARHELGYLLGLLRDGEQRPGQPLVEYSEGLARFSWAPIMGNTLRESYEAWPLFQFSRGEYWHADNKQDDLLVIQQTLPRRADDKPHAVPLQIERSGDVLPEKNFGQIERSTDSDAFTFVLTEAASAVELTVRPSEPSAGSMLDVELELLYPDGRSAVVNPLKDRSANILESLVAGTYVLVVRSGAEGLSCYGFPRYSSLGKYVVTGKVPGGVGTVVAPPKLPLAAHSLALSLENPVSESRCETVTLISWDEVACVVGVKAPIESCPFSAGQVSRVQEPSAGCLSSDTVVLDWCAESSGYSFDRRGNGVFRPRRAELWLRIAAFEDLPTPDEMEVIVSAGGAVCRLPWQSNVGDDGLLILRAACPFAPHAKVDSVQVSTSAAVYILEASVRYGSEFTAWPLSVAGSTEKDDVASSWVGGTGGNASVIFTPQIYSVAVLRPDGAEFRPEYHNVLLVSWEGSCVLKLLPSAVAETWTFVGECAFRIGTVRGVEFKPIAGSLQPLKLPTSVNITVGEHRSYTCSVDSKTPLDAEGLVQVSGSNEALFEMPRLVKLKTAASDATAGMVSPHEVELVLQGTQEKCKLEMDQVRTRPGQEMLLPIDCAGDHSAKNPRPDDDNVATVRVYGGTDSWRIEEVSISRHTGTEPKTLYLSPSGAGAVIGGDVSAFVEFSMGQWRVETSLLDQGTGLEVVLRGPGSREASLERTEDEGQLIPVFSGLEPFVPVTQVDLIGVGGDQVNEVRVFLRGLQLPCLTVPSSALRPQWSCKPPTVWVKIKSAPFTYAGTANKYEVVIESTNAERHTLALTTGVADGEEVEFVGNAPFAVDALKFVEVLEGGDDGWFIEALSMSFDGQVWYPSTLAGLSYRQSSWVDGNQGRPASMQFERPLFAVELQMTPSDAPVEVFVEGPTLCQLVPGGQASEPNATLLTAHCPFRFNQVKGVRVRAQDVSLTVTDVRIRLDAKSPGSRWVSCRAAGESGPITVGERRDVLFGLPMVRVKTASTSLYAGTTTSGHEITLLDEAGNTACTLVHHLFDEWGTVQKGEYLVLPIDVCGQMTPLSVRFEEGGNDGWLIEEVTLQDEAGVSTPLFVEGNEEQRSSWLDGNEGRPKTVVFRRPLLVVEVKTVLGNETFGAVSHSLTVLWAPSTGASMLEEFKLPERNTSVQDGEKATISAHIPFGFSAVRGVRVEADGWFIEEVHVYNGLDQGAGAYPCAVVYPDDDPLKPYGHISSSWVGGDSENPKSVLFGLPTYVVDLWDREGQQPVVGTTHEVTLVTDASQKTCDLHSPPGAAGGSFMRTEGHCPFRPWEVKGVRVRSLDQKPWGGRSTGWLRVGNERLALSVSDSLSTATEVLFLVPQLVHVRTASATSAMTALIPTVQLKRNDGVPPQVLLPSWGFWVPPRAGEEFLLPVPHSVDPAAFEELHVSLPAVEDDQWLIAEVGVVLGEGQREPCSALWFSSHSGDAKTIRASTNSAARFVRPLLEVEVQNVSDTNMLLASGGMPAPFLVKLVSEDGRECALASGGVFANSDVRLDGHCPFRLSAVRNVTISTNGLVDTTGAVVHVASKVRLHLKDTEGGWLAFSAGTQGEVVVDNNNSPKFQMLPVVLVKTVPAFWAGTRGAQNVTLLPHNSTPSERCNLVLNVGSELKWVPMGSELLLEVPVDSCPSVSHFGDIHSLQVESPASEIDEWLIAEVYVFNTNTRKWASTIVSGKSNVRGSWVGLDNQVAQFELE